MSSGTDAGLSGGVFVDSVPSDHDCEVASLTEICPSVYRLSLYAPGLAAIRPGQFVQVEIPGDGIFPITRRPLTVSRLRKGPDPGRESLELVFRSVGRGTQLLSRVRTGQRIRAMGPLGRGYRVRPGRWLLVGGGMGAAGFPLLAGRLEGGACLVGAGTSGELFLQCDPLPPHFESSWATLDGSSGVHGPVTALLDRTDLAGFDHVAVCGPLPMIRAVVGALPRRLLENTQVSAEARMACGWGGCEGCAIPAAAGYLKCCLDGPVFDATRIDWDRWRTGEEA